HEEEYLVENLRITVPAREQVATRDTQVVTHRDGFASAGARPSMLPQRLQQFLGPRLGAISTQSGPSILPRRLQGRLRLGSGPPDLSHNAHPSDEETLMSMLLRLTRENDQLRRNDDKRPREENFYQESSVPRESRSQKRMHHPRSHASSHTQNHRTPIVECLGGADAVLGWVHSPQHHRSRSVSRRSQYSKERSMSVSEYSSSDQIDLEHDMQRSCSLVPQRGQYKLAREALTWFNELRPRSIHTFPQLADKFSKYYHYNRKTINGSGTLFNLHMEKGESILDLVRKLRVLLKEVNNAPDDVVVQAFKNALPFDKSGLYNSLTLKPPETVQDLLVRAERYATVQEDSKYKQQKNFANDRKKWEHAATA
ncbi:hypothetical protein IFM89_017091, partial [Coptis chinensis]